MCTYIYRLSCCILFICISGVLLAQTADTAEQSAAAENTLVISPAENELSLQNNTFQISQESDPPFFLLLKLVFFLVIICAAVYGVLYLLKRSKRFTAIDDPFLKQVAALTLAPDKNLYVVTLTDTAYLIGASSASISLISEITDKDLISAMNLHAEATSGEKKDFSSLLNTFFPSGASKKNDRNPLDSFLSKQRERLQKNTVNAETSGNEQLESEART